MHLSCRLTHSSSGPALSTSVTAVRAPPCLLWLQQQRQLAGRPAPAEAGGRLPAGAKVLAKARADERVGVFVRRAGSLQVVEYSELASDDASATEPGASRASWAALLC